MRKRIAVVTGLIVVSALSLLLFLTHRLSVKTPPLQRAATRQTALTGAPTNVGKAEAAMTQRQLLSAILKDGNTPERAKAYFSLEVDPLPGVETLKGGGDPGDFDGTMAVNHLLQVWETLTPEQRKAAWQIVFGPPQEPTVTTGSASVSRASVFDPGLLAKLVKTGLGENENKPAWDYQALANNAQSTLSAMLGLPAFPVETVVDYALHQGKDFAITNLWYLPNEDPNRSFIPFPGNACHTKIFDQKFRGISAADAAAVITHEMFHCYQDRVEGSNANALRIPDWIGEGEATWVMAVVVPTADQLIIEDKWSLYASTPGTVYSQRSYDALGVFGHMSDLVGAGAVWPRLLPAIQAYLEQGSNAALTKLIEGNELQYYTSWGSSYFEVAGNQPWTMLGPWTPPGTGPAPTVIPLSSETNEYLSAGSDTSALYQLTGSAEILYVTLLTGYGRLHDQNFGVDVALDSSGPLLLCVKEGGCKCPEGSAAPALNTMQATLPISIGINGGNTKATGGVVTRPLDNFCKHKNSPNPSPKPGTGGGGGGGGGGRDNPPDNPRKNPEGDSYGDTHLSTFDGLHYDFQVVGEFTLVRSTQDDFLVQTRQVPVVGPKIASVNQAVATRVGAQRLSFALENGALVLRVDGTIASGPLPTLKGGSLTGATTMFGGTYQVTWPDGTLLRVEQLGAHAVNARVTPANSRRGKLEGLLGNCDGSQDNDLVGVDSKRLGIRFSSDDINHSLADAWRISKADSLFDYQPGQSPTTFTDRDFPAQGLDFAKITDRAGAEGACREQGITDAQILADCILDLAATNDFLFGSQYAHAQKVLAARAALLTPAGRGPQLETLWMSGEVMDAISKPVFHFDGKQGDVIWIHDPDCKDHEGDISHTVGLTLLDPDGKAVGQPGSGCQYGRRELPATGTYTFTASFGYKGETNRYRIPIRFVRPTRRQPIAYGQSASGIIEQPAAWDVYTFTGKSGDIVALEGEGCQLGWMITEIMDAEGHEVGGPICRKGTFSRLPKDGTYELIINVWNAAEPGPYQFVFQGGKSASE
jgi:hypothetical protein